MGKTVGDDLQRSAHQQARHFQRRRAAVEQDRVAVLNAGGGRAGDGALLVELAGRAFLQGRQRGGIADVHGPAVRAPQQSLLVPVIQIAAQRRFGNVDRSRQIGQRDEAALTDQIQHPLTAFLNQHDSSLLELERILAIRDR